MTEQQLYEAIFHRKSIRKYEMAVLPESTTHQVKDFAATVKPLDANIRYELSFESTEDVKNLLPIKAPHYVCLYSEKKGNYLMNAGFIMQQIDLYLSANNLASCWLGMAKPVKLVQNMKNGLEFVIMLAFGNSNEIIHRKETSEFNRKSLSAISTVSGFDSAELLEPVRLSPSASNSQPWFFSGTTEQIIVSREKLNLIKAALYGRMNQIDIGIALCHLWLSLKHQGKSTEFDFKAEAAPAGYEFMTKARIGN